MALIKCVECGKEFSDKAKQCPECACPTDYVKKEINKQKKSVEYECENCGKHFLQDLDKCPNCGVAFQVEEKNDYVLQKYMCSSCGESFVEDFDECPYCGTVFNEIEEVVAAENYKTIKKFKCENCGTFFEDDLDKCPNCSMEFKKNDNEIVLKRSTTSKIIISTILILILMSSLFNKYKEIYDITDPEIQYIILKNIVLNTMYISLLMMIIPLILWIKNNKNLSYKKARGICIKNSVILFTISALSKIVFDYAFIGGLGAIVYYFINMTLFSNKKTSN